jgi:hypothetical protein
LFLGQDDDIRETIMGLLKNLVDDFPSTTYIGTMGVVLVAEDIEMESMDFDENFIRVEFLVDPDLNNNNYSLDKTIIYNTTEK